MSFQKSKKTAFLNKPLNFKSTVVENSTSMDNVGTGIPGITRQRIVSALALQFLLFLHIKIQNFFIKITPIDKVKIKLDE